MVGRVGPHPTKDLLTLLTQLPGTHQFFFSRNVAVAVYHRRCSKEYIPGKFLAKRLCVTGGALWTSFLVYATIFVGFVFVASHGSPKVVKSYIVLLEDFCPILPVPSCLLDLCFPSFCCFEINFCHTCTVDQI